jgi:ribosomal protein S18 acetylase RimI-like enzyme
MQIRKMVETELHDVVALWHRTQKDAYPYLPLTQAHTLDDDLQFFRNVLLPECDIWVAEMEEQLVGFMALRGSYIDRLYVAPNAQRRGVGSALIEHAKRLSPAGLELHTHQQNGSGRRFYEGHCFQAVKFSISPPPESALDVEYRWGPAS